MGKTEATLCKLEMFDTLTCINLMEPVRQTGLPTTNELHSFYPLRPHGQFCTQSAMATFSHGNLFHLSGRFVLICVITGIKAKVVVLEKRKETFVIHGQS